MMQTTSCPAPEHLKAYLAGKLNDDSSDTLAQHLLCCPSCERTAEQLENDPDTLVELLQWENPSKGISPVDSNSARMAESAIGFNIPIMPEFLGQYKLLSRLGFGGMGAVYLAHHQSLDKQVAIKLLPPLPAQNPDFLARFQREMRAAGKLDHPAIVRTTDAGQQQGIHFLVMEAIDGLDLGRLLRVEEKLSIADASEVVRQAAIGLAHAHEKGIVHRDVKPSNLMLDINGQVRILDFGLAQSGFWESGSAEITTVGQLMGTLDYMAPEQAERGGAVDYRADLYSLGATLFRLLTGRAPLAAAPNLTPLEKLRLLATHRPPKLRSLRPDATESLSQIVDAMLAREPSQRPASATHVAELLEPFGVGADLVELLKRVRSKPSVDEVSFAFNPVLQRDLAESQIPVTGSAEAAALEPSSHTSGTRSKFGSGWLSKLLLGACFAVLCAGILLLLETSKGQLVIDSEVQTQVKIVSVDATGSQTDVDQIKIVPGTKSTRLKSGKYEITLDAPSDSFGLTNGTFTIQNGQTVVATIKQLPKPTNIESTLSPINPEAVTYGESSPEDPRLNEIVFDNEKLDTWLRRLKFERNPEEIDRTLQAIQQLASEDLKDVIREPLVQFVIREGTAEHHGLALSALHNCTGESLHESVGQILTQLRDERTKYGILSQSIHSIIGGAHAINRESLFLAEALKLLDSNSPDLALQAGQLLRGLTSELPDQPIAAEVQQAMLDKFSKTSALTNKDFWLAFPGTVFTTDIYTGKRSASMVLTSGEMMNREVVQRAISALADATTSIQARVQASIVLRSLVEAGVELSDPQKKQVIKSIAHGISQASTDTSLCQVLTEIPSQFAEFTAPILPNVLISGRGESTTCPMIQTMNLATTLKLKNDLRSELETLFIALHVSPLNGGFFTELMGLTPEGKTPNWIDVVQRQGQFSTSLPLSSRILYLQVGLMLGKSQDELMARFSQKLPADFVYEIDRELEQLSRLARSPLNYSFGSLETLPIETHPRVVPAIESFVRERLGTSLRKYNQSSTELLSAWTKAAGDDFVALLSAWTKAAGDDFVTSFARVLANANEESSLALVNLDLTSSKYFRCTKPTALEPLLNWCDRTIAGSTPEDKRTLAIIRMLTSLAMDAKFISAECQQMVVGRLEKFTFLDNKEFWLKFPPIRPAQSLSRLAAEPPSAGPPWCPPMQKAILNRAFAVIADDVEADDQLLCQALAIARASMHFWEDVPKNTSHRAFDQMRRRLDAAIQEPKSEVQLHETNNSFKHLMFPVFVDAELTKSSDDRIPHNTKSNQVLLILNMLVAAKKENSYTELQDSFKPKIQALHERIHEINLMDDRLSNTWNISWPDMLDRNSPEELIMQTWYMQSGSLLGLDADVLRKRPERLAEEEQERKRRFVQPRDTLAIYIPGLLPQNGDPPVIQAGKATPVIGFPVPVSQDGTIQLPMLEPIKVQDLELPQVQQLIEKLYKSSEILKSNLPLGITVQFLLRAGSAVELRNVTGNSSVILPTK